jgi:hypothetical protein
VRTSDLTKRKFPIPSFRWKEANIGVIHLGGRMLVAAFGARW